VKRDEYLERPTRRTEFRQLPKRVARDHHELSARCPRALVIGCAGADDLERSLEAASDHMKGDAR